MVKYGVATEKLVLVDLDKRTITTQDEEGREWEYELSEDIELDEKWIVDHLGEEITITYKETEEAYIVLRIKELEG